MKKPVEVQKILVINLAFIGDILLSTPAIRALKAAYPEAAIHMLVVPATAPVARGNPFVDQVIVYDKRGKDRNLASLWQLIRRLRAEHYDLAVAMNFALRGSLLAWASGARFRLGYDAQHAAPFLTHVASSSRIAVKHETENYLAMLKPLGIETGDLALAFRLDPAAVKTLDDKFKPDPGRQLVLICPFGRHPLNSWTSAGYIEVLRRLAAVADCVLIGGEAEKERLEEISAAAEGKAKVLAGVLSIAELAVLIARANLLISVDTGPLHLAGAVGTPVVGLFGRSDYRIWGPRGPRDFVLHHKQDCWPCYKRECEHHRCMANLEAQEVIEVALKILSTSQDSKRG